MSAATLKVVISDPPQTIVPEPKELHANLSPEEVRALRELFIEFRRTIKSRDKQVVVEISDGSILTPFVMKLNLFEFQAFERIMSDFQPPQPCTSPLCTPEEIEP